MKRAVRDGVIEYYDLESDTSRVVRELRPPDDGAALFTDNARISPDGQYYTYRSRGWLTQLYAVRGVR